jgi:hypothetical protein
MIAFEIHINGVHVVTASQEDWSVLAIHVDALRDRKKESDEYDLRFSVGGLSKENKEGFSEHFRWPATDLKIGDIVQFRLIETDIIDSPIKRYRSDHEVQEEPFTEEELKKMRYEDYLELKKEFEPKVT